MYEVAPKTSSRLSLLRRSLIAVGWSLLIAAASALVSSAFGLVPVELFEIAGNSGLKTIASVAVSGCLLAAVGYWDDYERD